MRIAVLICCLLALAMLALTGLSYMPGFAAEVSVTGTDNGVTIQNVGEIPCLVVVNSLEGEQQFRLAVGANVTLVTLSHITNPFSVGTFGSATVRVDLEEFEKWREIHEEWGKIKLGVSSNCTDPWPGQPGPINLELRGFL